LILLQHPHGTQKNPVPRGCLADWPPVRGSHYQVDDQYGRDNCCDNDKKFLLHPRQAPSLLRHLLWAIETILSIYTAIRSDVLWLLAHSGARTLSPMETLLYTIVESPIGPLFVAASDRGLVALEFDKRLPGQQTIRPNPRDFRAENSTVHFTESASAIRSYTRQLEEYFAGQRRHFDFPLDLRGTSFQLACWQALLAIPYGETRSYGDIARAVGRPQGFRAVGMANNRNPVAIVVPCHRVIASDGSLCGYGGGLEIKRKLLELEGSLSGTLAA
jgi:methylated-DNA-[protein]-cysteine S-methyltransferase